MNIIETIRAEIERINEDIVSNNIDCHPTTVIDDLLSFLDTLEEPKIVDGEDETELNSLAYLEQLGYTCIPPLNDQDMAQEKWKPIPEQLEAMEFVIRDYREDGCTATANYLQEIYEQIKKL